MIERNLGNIERIVRLVIGLAFSAWALMQTSMNGVEWFVVLVSLSLIFNGIFSRCYLWYLLDVNTKEERTGSSTSTSIC